MIRDQIKKLLDSRPFRPFTICMTDGHEVVVKHPEFFMFSPGGSTAIAYVSDEAAEVLHIVQITRVRFETAVSA